MPEPRRNAVCWKEKVSKEREKYNFLLLQEKLLFDHISDKTFCNKKMEKNILTSQIYQ